MKLDNKDIEAIAANRASRSLWKWFVTAFGAFLLFALLSMALDLVALSFIAIATFVVSSGTFLIIHRRRTERIKKMLLELIEEMEVDHAIKL